MPPSQTNKYEVGKEMGNPSTDVTRFGTQELQLRAEERWLVAAITKIKNQQNALQIERLHLDNMLRQRTNPQNNTANAHDNMSQGNDSRMADLQSCMSKEEGAASPGQLQSNVVLDQGDICNLQELNLSVNNDYLFIPDYDTNAMEEDEDEDDNELIDMKFLE